MKIYLLLFIIFLMLFLIFKDIKDSNIITNAKLRLNNLSNYEINSTMVVDLTLFNTTLRYLSTIISIKNNDSYYVKIVTTLPFNKYNITKEKFSFKNYNYSCDDNLRICYSINESVNFNNYFNVSYIYGGEHKIGKYKCDIIYFKYDSKKLKDLLLDIVKDKYITNTTKITSYSCIDSKTGISIESFLSIDGKVNYLNNSYNMNINITKYVNNISLTSGFIPELPYKVISEEEYFSLINNTL